MNSRNDFDTTLKLLADPEQPFPSTRLHSLSDLDRSEVAALEALWPTLPDARRLTLIQDLAELAEADFEVDFEAVERLALEDENPGVRAAAVTSLWECETPELAGRFFQLLTVDPAPTVRAAAASALGRYIYLTEMEELDPRQGHRLENILLLTATGNEDLEVRRRAVEALGFSSRPEVPSVIQSAYASPEEKMRASAVFAMGQTADKVWAPQVLAALRNPSPAVRFEAVRAAGELELRQAIPDLVEAIEDSDPEVRSSALWALGQVGGPRARHVLETALRGADEGEAELIEEALENLAFNEELQQFPLLDFEAETPDEQDEDDDG